MTATMGRTVGELETYRRELTGYCYRMLGSSFDAEDAVQDALIKAMRAADGFEGRASVRSWLYRITTNVCLDMLRARQRRAIPCQLGPARPPVEESLTDVLPDGSWVSPIADERILPPEADPAEVAEQRASVRLAFVAALQYLPPKQRAVLILCEVLRWRATEVAELLDTSVPAVNSALQRARATLADADVAAAPTEDADAGLLDRYVDAFQRYDIDALVGLLHEDALQTMPPYAMWLRGAEHIGTWMITVGRECRDSILLPTSANGSPAFGQYRRDPAGGHAPWALQVLTVEDGRISELHAFLEAERLFPSFGLPPHLPA